MPLRLFRFLVPATLLTVLPQVVGGVPAFAYEGRETPRTSGDGSISIRLLEIPSNRVDDPRSHVFIVDHVNPGTTFTRRLEVESTSSSPQHVEVYAAAAEVKRGRFAFGTDRAANELSSWIKINRGTLDLAPRGSAQVKATFAIPGWASKGERYAVIWAQVSSRPKDGANVTLVNRVGIRTYLDIGPGGEPPSNFKIGAIVPQRGEDGQPQVVADVLNTGQRAIDVDGQLTLTEGPSSMSAGPFRVERGTTLAPGERGDVSVLLGQDVPDGPWKFKLTLTSGRISHTATGSFVFPAKSGTWGMPASVDSTSALAVAVAGIGGLAVAFMLFFGVRRIRARAAS